MTQPTSEMIEAVARAIMDADTDAPYPWDSAPPSYRKAAREQAKAAIAAMAEFQSVER